MKIGFIGLGQMGSGMAANLVRAGHDVAVFNRNAEKRKPLVKVGARAAETVADACDGSEAVITMLANDGAVRDVALAKGGVVDALRKGAVHVSMSTVSVELTRTLAEVHARAGQKFLAAPVFGRPEAAEQAKLFVVAAGDPEVIRACQPLFEALGQKTFELGGEPTAASLTKIGGNFLIAAMMEALGEAMALVGKGGVEPQRFLDVMTSTLFPAPVYRTYGTLIAERKFSPPGFAAPLGHKDVRLLLAAGDALRVPLPLGSLLNDRFVRLLAQGGEKLDWSAIGQLAAEDAGMGREVK
jgi:3-hydroxyisobutyrate dehydrogenase-like beta-hydroxyacid dehydrogenase